MARLHASGPLGLDHLYARRPVDDELAQALLGHEYCCVLAPRKSGKSSLRVRVEAILKERDVQCIHVDASMHGANLVTAEQWYLALTLECSGQLKQPREQALRRWHELASLSPLSRFVDFVRAELSTSRATVVFIDEIDNLIAASQYDSDDFFAAIRALHNERADCPELRQLTFCLLGVATAHDLIRDPRRTPYNIGKLIYLRDFSRGELDAFASAFDDRTESPADVLDEIHAWTRGHPYMTHKLCCELVSRSQPGQPVIPAAIEPLARELFSRRAGHLDTVMLRAQQMFQRILCSSRGQDAAQIYRSLLNGPLPGTTAASKTLAELWLTGLVGENDGESGAEARWLTIRNRIFATTFDLSWLQEVIRDSRLLEAPKTGRGPRLWARKPPVKWLAVVGCLVVAVAAYGAEQLLQFRSTANVARSPSPVQARTVTTNRPQPTAQPAPLTTDKTQSPARPHTTGPVRPPRGVGPPAVPPEPTRPHMQAVPGQPDHIAQATETPATSEPLPPLVEQCGRGSALAADPNVAILATTLRGLSMSTEGLSGDPSLIESLATVLGRLQLRQPLAKLGGPEAGAEVGELKAVGNRLFAAMQNGPVRTWNLHTGAAETSWPSGAISRGGFAVSRDGQRAVTIGLGQPSLWAVESARPVQPRKLPTSADTAAADISADSQTVLVASGDSGVQLLDMQTGSLRATLDGKERATSARFSPDSQYVVIANVGCDVTVWRTKDQQPVFARPAGIAKSCLYPGLPVSFTADGTKLLTSTGQGELVVLRLSDGQEEHRERLHGTVIFGIAASPDGRLVATAGKDRGLVLYDLQRRSTRFVFMANAEVDRVRFSPDGQRLLATFGDRTVQLFSVASGRPLLEQTTDDNAAAVFSPDGHWLLMTEPKHRIRLVPLSPAAILKCACNVVAASGGDVNTIPRCSPDSSRPAE